MAKNIIKLNRGDSFDFKVTVVSRLNLTEKYILTSNDAVYFALLYPHQRFEDAIFIKGYDHTDQNKDTGEIQIKILPKDTKYLSPGIYYYTIKLQRGGSINTVDDNDNPEEFSTITDRTKFIINE